MDLDAGSYIDTSRQTVANYLDEWQRAKRAGLKPTTAAAYADSIRAHVVPRIGGVPLQKVDGALLDSFYADLLDHGRRDGLGGLSAKTVRNLHGILNKAFRDAVRWRRLARNPAEAASPPAKRSPETLIWSPEQLRTFLEQVARTGTTPSGCWLLPQASAVASWPGSGGATSTSTVVRSGWWRAG